MSGLAAGRPPKLAIGLARPDQDPNNGDRLFVSVGRKDDSIGADAPTKSPLPIVALEGLHISLERIVLQLLQNASDSFLNVARQFLEVFLSVLGKLTDPTHV